jgi:hypothetical protein
MFGKYRRWIICYTGGAENIQLSTAQTNNACKLRRHALGFSSFMRGVAEVDCRLGIVQSQTFIAIANLGISPVLEIGPFQFQAEIPCSKVIPCRPLGDGSSKSSLIPKMIRNFRSGTGEMPTRPGHCVNKTIMQTSTPQVSYHCCGPVYPSEKRPSFITPKRANCFMHKSIAAIDCC